MKVLLYLNLVLTTFLFSGCVADRNCLKSVVVNEDVVSVKSECPDSFFNVYDMHRQNCLDIQRADINASDEKKIMVNFAWIAVYGKLKNDTSSLLMPYGKKKPSFFEVRYKGKNAFESICCLSDVKYTVSGTIVEEKLDSYRVDGEIKVETKGKVESYYYSGVEKKTDGRIIINYSSAK